jgi:hypothetical protein
MGRVPITVMGYCCERCGHQWIPRDFGNPPQTCPKCKSPYWNRARKTMMTYEDFRDKIHRVLRQAGGQGLTWTEVRTMARLCGRITSGSTGWSRTSDSSDKRTRTGLYGGYSLTRVSSMPQANRLKLPSAPARVQHERKQMWNEARSASGCRLLYGGLHRPVAPGDP